MCLTTYFKHFVFIELFDLNSNPNSLFERSSITDVLIDFLVDLTMYICILPSAIFTSKLSLLGSILINLQPSSFSIAFCLSIS